jgi:hypothetical protein
MITMKELKESAVQAAIEGLRDDGYIPTPAEARVLERLWDTAFRAGRGGPSGDPGDPVMTVWVAPSGRMHARGTCSGGSSSRSMTRGTIGREQYEQGDRCRCLAWFPDKARGESAWRTGYMTGKHDVTRKLPARERPPASPLPAEWWDGYAWGRRDQERAAS